MGIKTEEKRECLVLTPENNFFDHFLSGDLKAILLRAVEDNKVNVVVNMTNITHIRSAGLGLLISAYKTLVDKGGSIKLCNMDENGKELFELCKLDQKIKIFSSEEEALESFGL